MAQKTGAGSKPDEQIDMRTLVRLGGWGAAACVALLAVVMATRSDMGVRRLSPAQAQTSAPVAPTTIVRMPEPDPETRRLVETVRAIASDRDKLAARLTLLERNLEDVTGSVGRLSTVQEKAPAPPAPPAPAPEALRSPGPTLGSTISVALALSGPPETRPASQGPSPAAPDEAATEGIEHGVDLGGAANLDALRALWTSVKAQHAALLEGLRPVISVREKSEKSERAKSGGVELRLVVGPLTDKAAATLCAALSTGGMACRPAPFDGQRLAAR